MAVNKSKNIYSRATSITYDFLGPTAKQIIDKQIRSQLHKDPDGITKEELLQLVDWIQSAVSLLTDNREMVSKYIGQLKRL